MPGAQIVVVDRDEHTAGLLVAELGHRGFGAVALANEPSSLRPLLAGGLADVVICNHHYREDHAFTACDIVRRMAPDCATIVIASAGPALAAVRAMARQQRSVDVIFEKPFADDRFYLVLDELLAGKVAARQARIRADRLANLVPAGALAAVGEPEDSQAELFDAAVLFTDIRDSSRLINQMAPREFFDVLNRVLSEQTRCIHEGQGAVVKYTGDGVMAIFRGMGRSYLALRCGLELAAMSRRQALPFGVGIAQGLVLAGLIGDASRIGRRRQYDVIGATAHLAARLCARAESGQLVVTSEVNAVARVRTPAPRPVEKVSIRGFAQPVDCVAFSQESP